MATLTYTDELVITSCWCGIKLAIPSNLHRRAHDEGAGVYCPIGHKFFYSETELQRERRARERAEAWLRRARERAAAEEELRRDTERRLSAQKGATTKARKRHAAGVCPVCRRSFKQVRDHMASQHPDYDPAKHVQ